MYVFVYGTLKKGQSNHRLIREFNCLGEATMKGTLYDLGPFPALTLEPANDTIHGEVYDVNTKDGVERLDYLEGYDPNSKSNFYDRVEVDCVLKDTSKTIKAYVYVHKKISSRYRYLPSGKWH